MPADVSGAPLSTLVASVTPYISVMACGGVLYTQCITLCMLFARPESSSAHVASRAVGIPFRGTLSSCTTAGLCPPSSFSPFEPSLSFQPSLSSVSSPLVTRQLDSLMAAVCQLDCPSSCFALLHLTRSGADASTRAHTDGDTDSHTPFLLAAAQPDCQLRYAPLTSSSLASSAFRTARSHLSVAQCIAGW